MEAASKGADDLPDRQKIARRLIRLQQYAIDVTDQEETMANAVTNKERAKTDAPSRKTRSASRNQEPTMANTLSDKEGSLMDAYWRAANYLSVGQIYLYDNPLLKQPLTKEHIKPRLLGHWGTTPGLNFIYVH